jgi:hypothetical protein
MDGLVTIAEIASMVSLALKQVGREARRGGQLQGASNKVGPPLGRRSERPEEWV